MGRFRVLQYLQAGLGFLWRFFSKDLFHLPKLWIFFKRYWQIIIIIISIYGPTFFSRAFVGEAVSFFFETWIKHVDKFFGEEVEDVEDELSTIYTYNNSGAGIALVISLFLIAANGCFEQVNVNEMNNLSKCQRILQKVFSTKYIFIYGLLFIIISSLSNMVIVFAHLHEPMKLKLFRIINGFESFSYTLAKVFAMGFLYDLTKNQEDHVRLHSIGMLVIFQMMGDLIGLLLSYFNYLLFISDKIWLIILSLTPSIFALLSLILTIFCPIELLEVKIHNNPQPIEQTWKTFLENTLIIFLSILSVVILQVGTTLCRDVWQFNLEEIFKIGGALEDEIKQYIFATAIMSVSFLFICKFLLPHTFEPIPKIRWATLLNVGICGLAMIAWGLKPTCLVGFAAVLHYCLGTLAVEGLYETLTSLFLKKFDLLLGYVFALIIQKIVSQSFIWVHVKDFNGFYVLMWIMIGLQLSTWCLLPLINKLIEWKNHVYEYTELVYLDGELKNINIKAQISSVQNVIDAQNINIEQCPQTYAKLVLVDNTDTMAFDMQIHREHFDIYRDQLNFDPEMGPRRHCVLDDIAVGNVISLRGACVKKDDHGLVIKNDPETRVAIFPGKPSILAGEIKNNQMVFPMDDHDWVELGHAVKFHNLRERLNSTLSRQVPVHRNNMEGEQHPDMNPLLGTIRED